MLQSILGRLRGPGLTAGLLRGGAASFLVTLAGYSSALVLQLVLTRILGAEEYGYFAYVTTWLVGLQLFVVLGLDTAVVRYVPQYAARGDWGALRGVLRRSAALVVPGGALVSLLTFLLVYALGHRLEDGLRRTFWYGSLLLPLLGLLALNQGALQSLKRVALSLTPGGILRPATLALCVATLSVWRDEPVSGAQAMQLNFLAYGVGVGLGTLWLLRSLPEGRLAERPRYATCEWLRVSLPLLLVREMRLLMDTIDVLAIGALIGTTEAGVYSVATRLARLTTFGQRAGNLVTAPVISELFTLDRRSDLQRAVTLASWASFGTSLALGVGLVAVGGMALGYFGEEFVAGRNVMVVLVAGLIVNAWTGPVGNLLNMTGHQNLNARIIVVTAALQALLVFPVIHLFGMFGAAVSTSILVAGKNMVTWFAVRRRIGINSSIFPLPPARR